MGQKQGYKHTDEAKAKMSAFHMGKKYRLGFKTTDETKAKQSAIHKGRPKSEAHKESIRVALLKYYDDQRRI